MRKHGFFTMNMNQYKFLDSVINNINIEILQHGYVVKGNEWRYYNINSPFNRLYFVLGGSGYIENSLEKIFLLPGNIYLIPLHSTYNYICDNYLKKFYIHFNTNIFAANDLFANTNSCLKISLDSSSLNILLKKSKHNNLSDIFWCKAFFLNCVSQLRKILK